MIYCSKINAYICGRITKDYNDMDKRSYFGVKSINGFYDVKEIRLPEAASDDDMHDDGMGHYSENNA